ncbi:TIGR03668 family PPOX class F420-dependent oxidoreductase [Kutzneria buriramensis]|uniref:PPOX class probable F420-dependent enzyme n=1 Tax=Kutzneria buriramensis TaxID=1045776 RepID=A0A3E0GV08_9PSEU|nr:TIGR03668 family PPOX class F420-dependent oxidoreductase [Kutzneria buriramensis]REH26501.1 PPOX class probable F420-dependent enzyme [Kutzneria buriramensis]
MNLERFARARVARLATVDKDGRPHLVPVTFAVHGDVIVIAVDHKPKTTTNLRRLRNIRENDQVSLLADHYDEDWRKLWWVRVDGTARILVDEAERTEPVAWLCAKYEQYRERPPTGPVIRIVARNVVNWSA